MLQCFAVCVAVLRGIPDEIKGRMHVLQLDTLQHTATHCNTLQHTATHCNTLQHTATHCNTLQHTATYQKRGRSRGWAAGCVARCSPTMRGTAPACTYVNDTLQHIATHCNTLQHTTAHYTTLQHAATQCHKLQHTASQYQTCAARYSPTMPGTAPGCVVAVCCTERVAVCCSMLQRVPVCCSLLQYVAVCCSGTIQHNNSHAQQQPHHHASHCRL